MPEHPLVSFKIKEGRRPQPHGRAGGDLNFRVTKRYVVFVCIVDRKCVCYGDFFKNNEESGLPNGAVFHALFDQRGFWTGRACSVFGAVQACSLPAMYHSYFSYAARVPAGSKIFPRFLDRSGKLCPRRARFPPLFLPALAGVHSWGERAIRFQLRSPAGSSNGPLWSLFRLRSSRA